MIDYRNRRICSVKSNSKIKPIIALMLSIFVMAIVSCAHGAKQEEIVPSQPETADLVSELGLNDESKLASDSTVRINSAVYDLLDFEDSGEYENAVRGLIDAPETLELRNADGVVVWSQAAYGFLDDYGKAPDTVNPSLWENTRNNHAYGLFEVCDGIYQVRGYDMANLTLIEGDTGWIVFDPLMSIECTQAALELVNKNLGERPIKAVIISHCHVDHYGGIKGLITEEQVADRSLSIEEQIKSDGIPIIVPEGFTEHAVAENVYAGKAMSRRANYQYGVLLEPGVTGRLAMGIGMGQSTGTVSFIAPTYEVAKTGETMVIDGVELEFQLTPGTEAPAEMNTWLNQYKALWMAENCTGTMHNLYTLRGAQVRDGAAWAKYITEAVSRYGEEVEVVFQSHNWPHWGNENVNEYLINTAAVYKFINDQTLAYINLGYTSNEISDMIKLPDALAQNWYTRQYYGTLSHNSKAVYQKYMGWYDANPVNLNPLTPSESSIKWVEYMGDVDEVLRRAKADFDAGEYQWVAEVTNTIVFADPENEAARFLCADALEQLGYQSESGPWRNAYLTAAKELRHGNSSENAIQAVTTGDVQKQMTAAMLFDYMGILLDKQALEDQCFAIAFSLNNPDGQYTLQVRNGVLLVYEGALLEDADVYVTCPKNALLLLLQGNVEAFGQASRIEGNAELLKLFSDNLNQFRPAEFIGFNIVEP